MLLRPKHLVSFHQYSSFHVVRSRYHCSLLSGVLREVDSVTYGVNNESVLNQLDDFDVGGGQLPQDIMHILLQGVLPYTIKAILQSFVLENHFFNIEYLNQKLSSSKFRFLPVFLLMMVRLINQVWFR